METIFKAAMSKIHATENIKKKTEEYLMENLTSMPSAAKQTKAKSLFAKRVIAAACAVALLCTASIGAYAFYETPTSYLSLDINPSVELGVNPFGKVVSAMAYNNDGKTILDGQNVSGSDVKDAVNTLVKSAAQKGFVANDGSTVIAVTSETDNDSTAAELEDAAEQGADSAVKAEGKTAAVQKENVALERRDEARKLGITPGKLNLIQKLQALDPSITVDQYKDAKVTEIMKKYVELKKSTLPNQSKKKSSSSSVSESSQPSSNESGETSAAPQTSSQPVNSEANQAAKNAGSSSAAKIKEDKGSQKSADTSSTGKAGGNSNNGKSVANSHKK